ncbi:MAG: hypothetical protein ABW219_05045 [Ilumatobacteraceae bacterium]
MTQPRRTVTATMALTMVAGCAAAVALIRWWTSRRRVVFHMNPDEPGQLAMARFLGGGTRWDMFDHSTWRPGYAALISPITWFTDDPAVGLRAALAVNAVLGGVACVLLYLLARRLTALSVRWCALAALAVSLAPTLLFTTDWVWSEALVQVTYLGCLLAVLRFLRRPSTWSGGAAAVLAACGFAAHSRLLPLSVVVVAVVVVARRRRQLTIGRAGGLVVLVAALDVGVFRLSSWVVDHVWDDPAATNTAGGVAGRLSEVTAILASTFGQVWYQLVATLGVAGLGVLALARAARRAGPATTTSDDAARPGTDAARLVLGTVTLLVGLSIVFMADRWRPDQLVYGRYNDVALAPVVLVGVGALVLERRARLWRDLLVVVAVTVGAGLVLRVWRDDELRAAGAVRSMMLGLLVHLGPSTQIRTVGITVVAAVLMVALVGGAVVASGRMRQVIVGVSLTVLLVGGYARTRPVVDRGSNSWDIAADLRGLPDVLPAGATVRMRLVPSRDDPSATWAQQRLRSMLYQFYLPANSVIRDTDPAPRPWTPYVFAPLRDPDLVAAGAELLWRDPAVSMGLWEEPPPTDG